MSRDVPLTTTEWRVMTPEASGERERAHLVSRDVPLTATEWRIMTPEARRKVTAPWHKPNYWQHSTREENITGREALDARKSIAGQAGRQTSQVLGFSGGIIAAAWVSWCLPRDGVG